MGFLGLFADLAGEKIGNFMIEVLAGRDNNGTPRWKIVCGECGYPQVVDHARAVFLVEANAPENLRCANSACVLSLSRSKHSESFAEFRQRERREKEEVARQTAHDAAQRNAELVVQAARDAKLAASKAEYRYFWNHQIQTRIEPSRIVTFDRWRQLTEGTRRTVLERISKDRTVFFEGL